MQPTKGYQDKTAASSHRAAGDHIAPGAIAHPAVPAVQKKSEGLPGMPPVQRAAPEEEQLQKKSVAQLAAPEEEKPLQG